MVKLVTTILTFCTVMIKHLNIVRLVLAWDR
jgi:hypothetical protein